MQSRSAWQNHSILVSCVTMFRVVLPLLQEKPSIVVLEQYLHGNHPNLGGLQLGSHLWVCFGFSLGCLYWLQNIM